MPWVWSQFAEETWYPTARARGLAFISVVKWGKCAPEINSRSARKSKLSLPDLRCQIVHVLQRGGVRQLAFCARTKVSPRSNRESDNFVQRDLRIISPRGNDRAVRELTKPNIEVRILSVQVHVWEVDNIIGIIFLPIEPRGLRSPPEGGSSYVSILALNQRPFPLSLGPIRFEDIPSNLLSAPNVCNVKHGPIWCIVCGFETPVWLFPWRCHDRMCGEIHSRVFKTFPEETVSPDLFLDWWDWC